MLDPATAASSLGDILGLGAVDEDELYAAIDWLGERQGAIEQARRALNTATVRVSRRLRFLSAHRKAAWCCCKQPRPYSTRSAGCLLIERGWNYSRRSCLACRRWRSLGMPPPRSETGSGEQSNRWRHHMGLSCAQSIRMRQAPLSAGNAQRAHHSWAPFCRR